jgi:hypothetical protein
VLTDAQFVHPEVVNMIMGHRGTDASEEPQKQPKKAKSPDLCSPGCMVCPVKGILEVYLQDGYNEDESEKAVDLLFQVYHKRMEDTGWDRNPLGLGPEGGMGDPKDVLNFIYEELGLALLGQTGAVN